MGIELKGHFLNQRQLDALVPALNGLIHGEISDADYEDACMKALEAAGCPLGYETNLDKTATVEERAARWIVDGRVGMSSKAIWAHMTGASMAKTRPPADPDDVNRCLLLLDLIPEWAPRMGEMVIHGGEWAQLAPIWPELASQFIEEAGLNWVKGATAPKTYAMMKAASAAATADHCPRCGGEGTLHTGISEAPTTHCNKCEGTGTKPPTGAGGSK